MLKIEKITLLRALESARNLLENNTSFYITNYPSHTVKTLKSQVAVCIRQLKKDVWGSWFETKDSSEAFRGLKNSILPNV